MDETSRKEITCDGRKWRPERAEGAKGANRDGRAGMVWRAGQAGRALLMLPVCALLFGGCAPAGLHSSSAGHYEGKSLEDVRREPGYLGERTVLVEGLDKEAQGQAYERLFVRGYCPVGTLTWSGPGMAGEAAEAMEDGLKVRARKVGASRVLWRALPLEPEDPTRPGETATAEPGPEQDREQGPAEQKAAEQEGAGQQTEPARGLYSYHAVFFARFDTRDLGGPLGVYTAAPDAAWLRQSETGKGVRLVTVLKGSKAEEAGLKPGDVIVTINGNAADAITPLVHMGEENLLTVWRDGELLEKAVVLD